MDCPIAKSSVLFKSFIPFSVHIRLATVSSVQKSHTFFSLLCIWKRVTPCWNGKITVYRETNRNKLCLLSAQIKTIIITIIITINKRLSNAAETEGGRTWKGEAEKKVRGLVGVMAWGVKARLGGWKQGGSHWTWLWLLCHLKSKMNKACDAGGKATPPPHHLCQLQQGMMGVLKA